MSEPWFERWGLIGYRPVNVKGRITLVVTAGAFLIVGALSLYFEAKDQEDLGDIFGFAAATVAVVGHWIIYTHMADPDWHR
jgi:hypothetical protein